MKSQQYHIPVYTHIYHRCTTTFSCFSNKEDIKMIYSNVTFDLFKKIITSLLNCHSAVHNVPENIHVTNIHRWPSCQCSKTSLDLITHAFQTACTCITYRKQSPITSTNEIQKLLMGITKLIQTKKFTYTISKRNIHVY